MSEPLITIGVTCYNAGDTIRRAVEGALAQSWSPFEILVVDDCSTDGSEAVLEELAAAHREIRIVRHEVNRGYPAAVNTLIAEARGAFIAIFDDDDKSAPDRLEKQHRRIVDYEASHPASTVLCYSNRALVRPGDRDPTAERLGIGRTPIEPSGPLVAEFALGVVKDDGRHCWGMFGSCTLMARIDALRELGGFDERFRRSAELDFAARAALRGAHFISVNEPLITQHVTVGADKSGEADLRYHLLLLEKHKPYLKRRRSYLGARCNMRAQYHRDRGRRWWWRIWYVAALACFPWSISRERLRASSLLARLGIWPARTVRS